MSEEAIILKNDAAGRVLVPVERRVEFVRSYVPLAYQADVMPKLVERADGEDVNDLLPRQWKAEQEAA